MKKIEKVLSMAFVFIMGIFFSFNTAGCGEQPVSTPPSASTVLYTISETLKETSDKLASSASGIDTEESSIANTSVMAYRSIEFNKGEVYNYLYINQKASQFLYIICRLAENALGEDNYHNDFEYDKIYRGNLNINGLDGKVYIKTSTTEDGVLLYFDFGTNYMGLEIDFLITTYVKYDFETNTVKSIELNYQCLPLMMEMFAVKYDLVNNTFEGFILDDYNSPKTIEQTNEIIDSYNNGTFTFDKMMTYNFHLIIPVKGNITDRPEELSFNAYVVNFSQAESTASIEEVEHLYNSVYDTVSSFKLRELDKMLKDDNAQEVDYVQNYADYGLNKSTFSTYRDESGKYYYRYTFLEYEEMLSNMKSVKEMVNNDIDATNEIKTLADNAVEYLENKGKAGYTGNFETYNNIPMELETSYFIENNSHVVKYTLKTSNNQYLSFETVNNSIQNLHYTN